MKRCTSRGSHAQCTNVRSRQSCRISRGRARAGADGARSSTVRPGCMCPASHPSSGPHRRPCMSTERTPRSDPAAGRPGRPRRRWGHPRRRRGRRGADLAVVGPRAGGRVGVHRPHAASAQGLRGRELRHQRQAGAAARHGRGDRAAGRRRRRAGAAAAVGRPGAGRAARAWSPWSRPSPARPPARSTPSRACWAPAPACSRSTSCSAGCAAPCPRARAAAPAVAASSSPPASPRRSPSSPAPVPGCSARAPATPRRPAPT